MVKDKSLIAKISRQGSHVTTSRGHPFILQNMLDPTQEETTAQRDKEAIFKKQPRELNLPIRSQSRPWEMLAPETGRGISSEEPSPPGERGADFVFWYSFGITLFLQTQYFDTENPLDEL